MFKINDNYLKLPGSYLFSTIAKKVAAYTEANPDAKIIRLGIGDVTQPIAPAIIEKLHGAVDEMGHAETFHGYAPDLGYAFLRDTIAKNDYQDRGCDISSDEIFVSDGAKCDCSNIQEIFSLDELVKIWSPDGISKSPAIFDPLKLRAINAEYIRRLSPEEFQKKAEPWIDRAVHRDIDKKLLCANLQPRCEVLGEIPEQLDFFDAVPDYDLSLYTNKKQKTSPESAKEALEALLPVLSDEALDFADRDTVFNACKAKAEELGKKNGWLLYPLGIALSGKQRTPGGGTDLACMMGRETTLARVNAAIEKLNG